VLLRAQGILTFLRLPQGLLTACQKVKSGAEQDFRNARWARSEGFEPPSFGITIDRTTRV